MTLPPQKGGGSGSTPAHLIEGVVGVEIHPIEGWRGWFSTSAEVGGGGATPSIPLWAWRATSQRCAGVESSTPTSLWGGSPPLLPLCEGVDPPSTASLYGEGGNGVDLHLFFINFFRRGRLTCILIHMSRFYCFGVDNITGGKFSLKKLKGTICLSSKIQDFNC